MLIAQTKMDCVDILIQEQRLLEVSYTAEIKAP